jgi:predicted dehydrogenase
MKIFIIGCGRIFSKHIESIKALGQKKLKIVGISDKNKKKLLFELEKIKCSWFL